MCACAAIANRLATSVSAAVLLPRNVTSSGEYIASTLITTGVVETSHGASAAAVAVCATSCVSDVPPSAFGSRRIGLSASHVPPMFVCDSTSGPTGGMR